MNHQEKSLFWINEDLKHENWKVNIDILIFDLRFSFHVKCKILQILFMKTFIAVSGRTEVGQGQVITLL